MKGQFALVLDEDLSGVAHEFAASELDLLVEGGGEHHDLFAMRRLLEDVLDVRAHVDILENLIALVEDEHLEVVQFKGSILGEMEDTAWGADNDVRSVGALEHLLLLLERLTTQDALSSNVGDELGETSEFTLDLVGELTSVSKHDARVGLWVLSEDMEGREDKDGSLTHTRDSLAEHINTHNSLGDALLLDVTGMLESTIDDGLLKLGSQNHVLEGCGMDTDVISGGLGGASSGSSGSGTVGGLLLVLDLKLDLFVVGEGFVLFYHSIAKLVKSLEI